MLKKLLAWWFTALVAMPAFSQSPASGNPADRMIEARAFETVIWAMSAVNYDLMREELLKKTSGKENQIVYWGRPVDWRNQTLTPNPDTIYFMAFFNTKDGPIVLDIPAARGQNSLNGNIVNVWQMPLEDAGRLGADKGAGGKYLLLPPDYKGNVPSGYIVLQSDTFGGYALIRSNLVSHDDADVANAIAYGKTIQVYPLAQAAKPPATVFTDAKDVMFDSTIRYDASFFNNVDRIVQTEPWLPRDRIMIDQLKSLGIEKGKPFSPNDTMKKQLDSAAHEAGEWLNAKYEASMSPFFSPASHWTSAVSVEFLKSQENGFSDPNSYPVDERGLIYTFGYVGVKHLGVGQMYLISFKDKDGQAFDGSKTYRLTVPPNVPVQQYWSVTAYDRQTHALIRNMPRASRSSRAPELQKNADGSADIYFGPTAPAGKESNWIPTDPGRQFELMVRLYAPTKALFEKKWTLPDVEKMAVQ
ncbi:MAG TPA: DUF1254 domain-containing protein [Paraburkholderia sp.]|uniref:DUF1254 domain-containing protein n=1 Tax=Paraburkholderia sp. TaxID=1926495 RepID=UPI002ED090FA